MSSGTGLHVDDLTKRFGEVVALDGMSFGLERGGLVGFLGPNGSGKTTTMRTMMGLLRPDSGQVRWDGLPVDAATRSRFGYMPEERGLYGRMPLLDQVTYFAELAGLSRRDARASGVRWLEALGLGDRLNDDVGSLSHGNQQRVQLAVALAHEPDLLVLDEPFSGLDPIAAATMQSLLSDRAANGAAVLFSSHQLDMVEELCDDVVIVHGGRVVAAGPVERLRAQEPVRTLRVTFEQPTTDTSWAAGLPSSQVVATTPDLQTLEVPADLDLTAALSRAEGAGTISRFSFEPPDLSVVFRNAVERSTGEEVAA
jgi:ABC-2 type transport system ATP-binding protein